MKLRISTRQVNRVGVGRGRLIPERREGRNLHASPPPPLEHMRIGERERLVPRHRNPLAEHGNRGRRATGVDRTPTMAFGVRTTAAGTNGCCRSLPVRPFAHAGLSGVARPGRIFDRTSSCQTKKGVDVDRTPDGGCRRPEKGLEVGVLRRLYEPKVPVGKGKRRVPPQAPEHGNLDPPSGLHEQAPRAGRSRPG